MASEKKTPKSVNQILAAAREASTITVGQHTEWIRENLRWAREASGQTAFEIQLASGIAATTQRNFLVVGKDSGIETVLGIVHALGLSLCDVDRSPVDFRKLWRERQKEEQGGDSSKAR